MSTYIDRTKDDKRKSISNKQRFLKRIGKNIKKSLPVVINENSIKDLTGGDGRVKIPIKGVKEPHFEYDQTTGNKRHILPGNKSYKEGDTIRKPKGGGGRGGRKGSKEDNTYEDEFVISVTKEEFMEYFFSDLELPEMVKKHLEKIVDWKIKRHGYKTEGNPSQLNVVKSYKNSLARKMATTGSYKRQIEELEEKLKTTKDKEEIKKINDEISKLKKLMTIIPFMDDLDLKYNNFEKEPIPTTQAVVFCVMDVSGSMTEHHKDLAKRFFILLYLFLTKEYEKIDIVYIRHHTQPKEVSEDEFFDSRETGGTMVLPALELVEEIFKERYNYKWNSYLCQMSDGDVWSGEDAEQCKNFLENNILPHFQYAWYIEVGNDEKEGDLTNYYKLVQNKNFKIARITKINEIWKTFRGIFVKDQKSYN